VFESGRGGLTPLSDIRICEEWRTKKNSGAPKALFPMLFRDKFNV
jgi:hypothetical protein